MYIKNVPVKIYTYEDIITDSILKEKVLESNYDINVDTDFWYEDIFAKWTEKLNSWGFINAKIYFSGFNSQGDGACFECDEVDFEKLLINLEKTGFKISHKKYILNFLSAYCVGYIVKNRYGYHYEHSNSRNFIIGNRCFKCLLNLEKILDKIESEIDKTRKALSDEIYKELYEAYYYLTSESAILETLKINEYEFLENGCIA